MLKSTSITTAPKGKIKLTTPVSQKKYLLDFFLHRRHRSVSTLSDTTEVTVRAAASRLGSPIIPETNDKKLYSNAAAFHLLVKSYWSTAF